MEDANQTRLKRKSGKIQRIFSFLGGNWIVILILLMFASQVYAVLQIRKLTNLNADSVQSDSFSNDINQMKSMMSSLFSRIGTIQGDLNYIKSRR